MEHEYERRVTELMEGVASIQAVWAQSTNFTGYRDAKKELHEFEAYKVSTKRSWVSEKRDLDTLLG